MKLSILALALFAASASAQVFSPIARINPLGLPTVLPSPTIGPIARPSLGLPAPALTPSLVLSAPALAAAPLAPSAVAASAVAVFPNPVANISTYDVNVRHENVRHPMSPVLPGLTVHLAANDNGPHAAPSQQDKDDLDNLFDRGTTPSAIPAGREPVGDSRHISLPEWDLERELGL